MLDEQLVNGHGIFLLGRDRRDAGKKAFLVGVAGQCFAVVAEIGLKRRIGNHVIELRQVGLFIVHVKRKSERISLDHVVQRMDKVVQDQVQPEELRRLLRDILGIEAALLLADLVGQRQQQTARTGRGIIEGDALHRLRRQDAGHDLGHGRRGVVLGILPAVFVVVFNKVLENGGEEIVLLGEHGLETEGHQLVDNGLAKGRFLPLLNDVLRDGIEQADLLGIDGGHGEEPDVQVGDLDQGVVEQVGKAVFVLLVEQVADEVGFLQPGGLGADLLEHVFVIAIGHFQDVLLDVRAAKKVFAGFAGFVEEFVVEELVEKYLGDDLVFAAGVAETEVGTDGLQAVD